MLNVRLEIALSILIGIAFGFSWPNAFATQCVRFSPETYYERSDVIFVGTVIDIENEPRFLEQGSYVSLNVSKSWKGVDTKTITVNAEGGRFREVNEFLVYAEKNFLAIEVTFCGGTIQTDSDVFVDRELAYLENDYPTIELKDGHTVSMNPFPLLGLIGAIVAIAIAAVGILKSGITLGMLKGAVPVFAGLIAGVLFIWLFSNITFPANIVCYARPLDHIEKLSPIPVMVPSVLPPGYSYQGGEIVMGSGASSLMYFSEPACGANPKTIFDGMILISGKPLDTYVRDNMTGTDYIEDAWQYWKQWKEQGITVERYSFADGRSAVGMTEWPPNEEISKVLIADDNSQTWYEVSAKLPLDETKRIAESLQER